MQIIGFYLLNRDPVFRDYVLFRLQHADHTFFPVQRGLCPSPCRRCCHTAFRRYSFSQIRYSKAGFREALPDNLHYFWRSKVIVCTIADILRRILLTQRSAEMIVLE